jgi:hypothetical protein
MFAGMTPFSLRLSIDQLNRLVGCAPSASERCAVRFVAQTPYLLADGLHYEERIARHGVVATREGNTHDLFNALVWLRHAELKRAMNRRQVADIARVGPKQRTRAQCALTHFDEAGAIVWIADVESLRAWDAHDWRGLFFDGRDAWGSRIAVTVIGHALFDHALAHRDLPVAKALAVRVEDEDIVGRVAGAVVAEWREAEQTIAEAISAARLLSDPQELRPLPLAGIPGWHADECAESFYETAPCFRPLRRGRRYPAPFVLAANGRPGPGEDASRRALAG